MKKIFKKNQIIITALALMLAVAGYVSFAGTNGKDDKVAAEANAGAMEEDFEISDEDEIAENSIFTDTEDNSTETMANSGQPAEGVVEDSLENPGEAMLAETNVQGMDYAAEMKLNREQVRSKNKETLLDVINNKEIDAEQKQAALDQMVAMTNAAEREAAAEMLLEAKGFEDVVVSITDDSADVVLDMGEVTDAKRAQIEDIVKRKTSIAAENIIITPIQMQNGTAESTGTK